MASVQDARRAALRRQADQREQRLHRQRHLDAAAVQVAVALAERDAAIATAEQRAGHALHTMTAEGLTLREAADWCGGQLTFREAARLHRLTTPDTDTDNESYRAGSGAGVGDGSAASSTPPAASPELKSATVPDVEGVGR